MINKRFTLRSSVCLLLIRDNKILLARRYNTGWNDGNYSGVAGHLEGGETVKQAMVREAKEEADINIDQKDLEVVHTLHLLSEQLDPTYKEYVIFYLSLYRWSGEPKIMEPDKCDELRWFPLGSLPENISPRIKQALDCYSKGVSFSEMGFEGYS